MRGDQRLDPLNHFATVTLECIGDVVVTESEYHADEVIDDAIENQFVLRIIDDAAAAHKTGSEYTFKAFLKFAVVADQVERAIGTVGHHDSHRISSEVFQTETNGHSKTVAARISKQADLRIAGGKFHDAGGRGVVAAIIHHDYLERNAFL